MEESLNPSVIRKVVQELKSLERQPLEGIKVVLNEENIADVQAWIFGPEGTPFEGGFFKVKLQLGSDFPNAPPKGYFVTKVFHPNVSKTGEICVNTLKKDWKKELGISHVLLTVKCLLIAPNPESALNEDAGRLLLEDYESYAQHAKLWTTIHANNKPSDISFANTNINPQLASQSSKNVHHQKNTGNNNNVEFTPSVMTDSTNVVAMAAEQYNVVAPPSNSSADCSPKKRTAKEEKNSKKRSLKRL